MDELTTISNDNITTGIANTTFYPLWVSSRNGKKLCVINADLSIELNATKEDIQELIDGANRNNYLLKPIAVLLLEIIRLRGEIGK